MKVIETVFLLMVIYAVPFFSDVVKHISDYGSVSGWCAYLKVRQSFMVLTLFVQIVCTWAPICGQIGQRPFMNNM